MSIISKAIRRYPSDPDVMCANCGAPNCVWAHLPFFDAGMGQKCDDYFGAPLCQLCHDYVDGRRDADAMGHSNQDAYYNELIKLGIVLRPASGRTDYEWQYRVLRKGISLLVEAGILRIQGVEDVARSSVGAHIR